MKQVAYARVVMPDGQIFKRELVTFDDAGCVHSHSRLIEELPFTEWRNETFYWSTDNNQK